MATARGGQGYTRDQQKRGRIDGILIQILAYLKKQRKNNIIPLNVRVGASVVGAEVVHVCIWVVCAAPAV